MSLDLGDSLESLSDVLVENKQDGQVMVWDESDKIWKNTPQGDNMIQDYIQLSRNLREVTALQTVADFSMTHWDVSGTTTVLGPPLSH